MKKKIYSLFTTLILLFIFCSCAITNGEVKIINAENMKGAAFDKDIKSVYTSTDNNGFKEFDENINENDLYPMLSDTSVTRASKISTSSNNVITSIQFEDTAVTVHTSPAALPETQEYETSITQRSQISTTAITSEKTPLSEASTTTASTTTATTTTATTTTDFATTSTTAATSKITTASESTTTARNLHDSDYIPLNYNEVKGIWISYIELADVLRGKSETEFRKDFSEMMDNCVDFNINTVYVHLRPFGDAIYKSELYPWSAYVTGKLGSAPSFDPLQIMLEEAHSRKISFHGWINPMRVHSDKDISTVSTRYQTGVWYNSDKKGNYIVKSGEYWYLNPAYDDVIKLVADGAYEIVSQYNVDGLHIDDYFYPTTDSVFDIDAFGQSGYTNISDFRFDRSSALVKSIYNSVKKVNQNVLFGISPQGSVENNYNYVYADVKKWCAEKGYCDYIAPQIYYGFENSAQPYEKCLETWHEMVKNSSVKVVPGLALYKIGAEDVWAGSAKSEWINNNDIIKRQIEAAKEYADYNGIIFYSYNHLFNNNYITGAHSAEIAAIKTVF